MRKITQIDVLDNYRIRVVFDSGESGIIDLSDLVGSGVFVLWDDYQKFREVKIGRTGELIWTDQVDLCPDALYLRLTGKNPEHVFPNLKHESTDA